VRLAADRRAAGFVESETHICRVDDVQSGEIRRGSRGVESCDTRVGCLQGKEFDRGTYDAVARDLERQTVNLKARRGMELQSGLARKRR